MKANSYTFLLTILFGWTLTAFVEGQVVVYDNLANVRRDGSNSNDWLTPLGSDVRFAQQFFSGDNTSLSQVTVSLLRPKAGAMGSVGFELWRDNGSGQPAPVNDSEGKIADLGQVIDVTQIPVGVFGEFKFENLILGLEPNQPYWIVSNNEDLFGIGGGSRSVGIAVVFGGDPGDPDPSGYDATDGTSGAADLHAYRNQDPFWGNLSNIFGLEHFYQALRVEATKELGTIDIDNLSSAIRQSLTDTSYDINQDETVDAADRVAWLEVSANTTFGDANLDGVFNAEDMTLAFSAGKYEDNISLNSSWSEGDWNGDGDFNSEDLLLANTLVGDANLDGTVDFPDFLALSAGFGNAGGWAQGDFDGNGEVEFPDFLALSANFGQATVAVAAVPEPSSLWLLCVALIAIARSRRFARVK